MPEAAPEAEKTKERIVLSAKVDEVVGGPLPAEEILRAAEDYEGHYIRANISATTDGTDRKVVRPTITEVNGASAIEMTDVLFAIAWADCNKKGKKSRYCANFFIEEGGKIRTSPIRAYFWLSPDDLDGEPANDTPVPRKTTGPSLEYVHGLEETNLRTLDRLSRASYYSMRHREQSEDISLRALVTMSNTKLAEGRNAVDLADSQARHSRNDKILTGVVSIFPALAQKYLGVGDKADEPAKLSAASPPDRLKAFLTGEELERFIKAIGDEKWKAFQEVEDIEAARKLLATLPSECAQKIVDAIGEEKIFEISSWQ